MRRAAARAARRGSPRRHHLWCHRAPTFAPPMPAGRHRAARTARARNPPAPPALHSPLPLPLTPTISATPPLSPSPPPVAFEQRHLAGRAALPTADRAAAYAPWAAARATLAGCATAACARGDLGGRFWHRWAASPCRLCCAQLGAPRDPHRVWSWGYAAHSLRAGDRPFVWPWQ